VSRALFALIAIGLAGCTLGYGRPYPGASIRLREGERWASNGNGTATYIGPWSERGGDTPIGFLVGLRGGYGSLHIGDRKSDGFNAEFAGEGYFMLNPWFGVGAALGHEYTHGSMPVGMMDSGGADVKWGRTYGMLMAEAVPLRPFLLRAGIGGHFGGVSVDDVHAFDASGAMATVGGGIAFPFVGLHFVVVVDKRLAWGGDSDFGNGVTGNLQSDGYTGSMWIVF
jgi:hypothetical protein